MPWQCRADLRSGSDNLGHCLKLNSGKGNGILSNHWSISVSILFYFFKDWLWFRLQSVYQQLALLWVDGFAINGRLRHKHANKFGKLKDAELRCWTPYLWAHGRLIAPDPMSALCYEWIPIKYYGTGNVFIFRNFTFQSKKAIAPFIARLASILSLFDFSVFFFFDFRPLFNFYFDPTFIWRLLTPGLLFETGMFWLGIKGHHCYFHWVPLLFVLML